MAGSVCTHVAITRTHVAQFPPVFARQRGEDGGHSRRRCPRSPARTHYAQL